MRLVYVLGLLTLFSLIVLWSGWYCLIKRRLAVMIAVLCILSGGILLLAAVLPNYSFYGLTVTDVPRAGKAVALTFDDGPYPPYTEELLEILQQQHVHATFFLVAENAVKYPELVQKIASQGHEIALHAFRHRDFLKLSADEQQKDVATGKALLQKMSGQKITLMRPPHGFRDWSVMKTLAANDLTAVNWSVIPRDWTNPGTEVIVARVLEQVQPGAIVLLHDGDSPKYAASREQTVQAVGIIINKLQADGYSFLTVSELLEKGV